MDERATVRIEPGERLRVQLSGFWPDKGLTIDFHDEPGNRKIEIRHQGALCHVIQLPVPRDVSGEGDRQ